MEVEVCVGGVHESWMVKVRNRPWWRVDVHSRLFLLFYLSDCIFFIYCICLVSWDSSLQVFEESNNMRPSIVLFISGTRCFGSFREIKQIDDCCDGKFIKETARRLEMKRGLWSLCAFLVFRRCSSDYSRGGEPAATSYNSWDYKMKKLSADGWHHRLTPAVSPASLSS